MASNMQAATKTCFLAFWVAFFTLAKSQDCKKESIDVANVLKSEILESYSTGQTLRLKCITGYVGLVRLECENGIWIKSGRECKKRSCGHPGETPNGQFTLEGEAEFVFGSRVEYTCNTGYIMASRINYRNCRSQGWDNAVPVCEVVKCPRIRNLGEVIATGNTEEPSFGDAIYFECPPTKMLNGSADISCRGNGQWSDVIPTCKEIQCRSPKIPHGVTDLNRLYNNNNVLQYDCETDFRKRPGTSKCTKNGWSIQPACEDIVCEYPHGDHLIIPQHNGVYTAKNKIQYLCEEGYSRKNEFITCTATGWSPKPECIQITCQKLTIPNGHMEFRSRYRANNQVKVYCNNNYEPETFTVTCNSKGKWDNLKECTLKKENCAETFVKNGFTQPISKGFSYSCDQRYKAFDEKWWGAVTCTQGQWSFEPKCIPTNECGQIPNVHAKHNQAQKGYKAGETLELTCDSKPCCFKCIGGNWEQPDCKETCGTPPLVENAVITSHSQHQVKYECRENYRIKGTPLISCTNSQWDPKPTCELKKTCKMTSVQNGFTEQFSDTLSYSCDGDYKTFDGKWWGTVTCNEGQWSYEPKCIPKKYCGQIPNVHAKYNQASEGYKPGEIVEFACDSKCCFKCNNEKWEDCEETCGAPPPVENAIITSHNQNNVTYACRQDYRINGNPVISCTKSKWDPAPTCEQNKNGQIRDQVSISNHGLARPNVNPEHIKD